jgi:pimeloyl-ACP methyl ester carboxylesterase
MFTRFRLLFLLLTLFSFRGFTQKCDKELRPLVLIHGFLGGGDNYAPLIRQLSSAGYCVSRCFVFDWNTLARVDQSKALDLYIDSILTITKAKKADLVGHSAGGGIAYKYLSDSSQAAKIARYVHIGSSVQKTPAGPGGVIPTLNIYSLSDKVARSSEIPGATNLTFSTYDHFEVVSADSVAAAIFSFLNGGRLYKQTIKAPLSTAFSIEGKVLSLGENTPQPGSKLVLRKVLTDGSLAEQTIETIAGSNGRFQFEGISSRQSYMLTCYPLSGRTVAYFLPQIAPEEKLLYLRTLPTTGLVALLIGGLPNDTQQTAMVVFSNQKAVLHGRDSLWVQGAELSTAEFASPAKTAIAWFLYDANNNGVSDTTLIPAFASAPFMRGVDLKIEPGKNAPVSLSFNGMNLKIPAIPSSDGIVVVVL